MNKRPTIDLKALTLLTSDDPIPMPEATQRSAVIKNPTREGASKSKPTARIKTQELVSLSFKVPPEFHKSYCMTAAKAGLKLNELLFASHEAWQAKYDK